VSYFSGSKSVPRAWLALTQRRKVSTRVRTLLLGLKAALCAGRSLGTRAIMSSLRWCGAHLRPIVYTASFLGTCLLLDTIFTASMPTCSERVAFRWGTFKVTLSECPNRSTLMMTRSTD
jgi:hypothetical protein